MPSPANTAELLDLVARSGVADDARIAAFVDSLRHAGRMPADPVRLAEFLVAEGLLTRFQAEQLLQGKWKRFNIGKYKVLERLGSGGMGSVYLCEHTLMRRRVAVKVLPAAKAEDPSALERFYREGRVVGALDHPNIVRAYDIDQDDKLHFLVMEHVDGASLQEILKRAGPLAVDRACHYMRQAALGLQHAHEQAGIVHRDIKPGNILVDRNGIVKVLDMGLARFFHDEDDILTRKYDENVLGTADYLAPEQALDSHTVDIRADVYSLGATFYFTLTGKPPFAEGTVAQKLMWHQTRQPRSIRLTRPEVPEAVCAIIDKMMAKDPAQRYQTPLEIVEALAPFTQTPIAPPPESEMPQLSRAAMASDGPRTQPATSPTAGSSQRRPTWQVSSGSSPGNATPQPVPQPAAPQPTTPVPNPAVARRPVEAAVPAQRQAAPAPQAPARTVPPPVTRNGSAPQAAPRPGTLTATAPARDEPAWEDVADETDSQRPSSRSRRNAPAGSLPWLWIVLAAGLLVAIVLGVYSLFSSGTTPRETTEGPRGPLVVDPQGGDGSTYRTVYSAWHNAKPGDRIVLRGTTDEPPVILENRDNITLEAEPGKTFVWKSPPNWSPNLRTKTLLDLRKLSGVTFRGVTFDGANTADRLVSIFDRCPGLKFERCSFVNFKKQGVYLYNAEGDKDRPIEFRDGTIKTGEKTAAGVYFDHNANAGYLPKTRFVTFQGVKIEGPTVPVKCLHPDYVQNVTLPEGVKLTQGN